MYSVAYVILPFFFVFRQNQKNPAEGGTLKCFRRKNAQLCQEMTMHPFGHPFYCPRNVTPKNAWQAFRLGVAAPFTAMAVVADLPRVSFPPHAYACDNGACAPIYGVLFFSPTLYNIFPLLSTVFRRKSPRSPSALALFSQNLLTNQQVCAILHGVKISTDEKCKRIPLLRILCLTEEACRLRAADHERIMQ